MPHAGALMTQVELGGVPSPVMAFSGSCSCKVTISTEKWTAPHPYTVRRVAK